MIPAMPYKSRRQARLFHAKAARGEISPKVVKEFDQATQGHFDELPEKVKRGKKPVRKR